MKQSIKGGKQMQINKTKITKVEVAPWLYDCHMSCGNEILKRALKSGFVVKIGKDGRTWILRSFTFRLQTHKEGLL